MRLATVTVAYIFLLLVHVANSDKDSDKDSTNSDKDSTNSDKDSTSPDKDSAGSDKDDKPSSSSSKKPDWAPGFVPDPVWSILDWVLSTLSAAIDKIKSIFYWLWSTIATTVNEVSPVKLPTPSPNSPSGGSKPGDSKPGGSKPNKPLPKFEGKIGCRNDEGKPVDWFIMLKLPYRFKAANAKRAQGAAYMYMDDSTNGELKLSERHISEEGCISNTLTAYYAHQRSDDVFRMFYNDEVPIPGDLNSEELKNTSFTKGHAKGATVFDKTSGFWLIHSVPKFPPIDEFAYPSTGRKYAQALLCLSLPYSMLKEVGAQLQYIDPYIYGAYLPEQMAKDVSVLDDVMNGKEPSGEPYNRKTTLTTEGGTSFTSFAKYGEKKWRKELYADFVAPTLEKGLFTETWQHGEKNCPSSCTGSYHVYNIKKVKLSKDIEFDTLDDHSKWAVTDKDGSVCIGDINRQLGQFGRGGGTACKQDAKAWKTFRDAVADYEKC